MKKSKVLDQAMGNKKTDAPEQVMLDALFLQLKAFPDDVLENGIEDLPPQKRNF